MARKDYTLVVFDQDGKERKNDAGQLASAQAIEQVKSGGVTDVFLMSHGWMGDIPSAISQYNGWTDAVLACTADLAALKAKRPGFTPLLVGVHWPSLPWGDEGSGSFAAPANPDETFDPVSDYTERLGGTKEIRDAVSRIFSATAKATDFNVMPEELKKAYLDLNDALGMGSEGPAGPPDADRKPFDPQQVFRASQQAQKGPGNVSSFGGFGLGGLLAPLRTLSFWKMKNRARKIGESGVFNLLLSMQRAAGEAVKFHLMGHSFGCIVVSATLRGPDASGPAISPVQSAVLVQGALSLWSFAPKIVPDPLGGVGYFHPVIKAGKVEGPIATTQSRFDRAVGLFYPIAAGIALQTSFDPSFPLFGGVGSFGAQGLEGAVGIPAMIGTDKAYDFQPGQVYNIESSNIIKAMVGLSGAHSDINHPEVGHVILQAALAA